MIGRRPPALRPMKKHATRFQWKAGMALHIAVPMNRVAARRIDARRPMLSPRRPQISAPRTVPTIATNGKSATGQCPGAGCDGERRLYSFATPGRMNVKVNGFWVSTATPNVSTAISFRCRDVRRPSSSSLNSSSEPASSVCLANRGERP